MTAYIVITAIDYAGDYIEGVFFDLESAQKLAATLSKSRNGKCRIEEWHDGGTTGYQV